MAKIKEATVKIPKAPEQKVIKFLRKQQLILNQEYRHLDKNSWKSSTRNFFWKMSQNLQKTTYGGVSVLKKTLSQLFSCEICDIFRKTCESLPLTLKEKLNINK